jgi:DNA (cytosine-5)-methyltransferase 1
MVARCRGGGQINSPGYNADSELIAFDTTQITSRENRARPMPGDPCHPLAAGAHAPAIAFNARQDPINGPVDRHGCDGVLHRAAVRRLTPVECARLQGFPDDYLDIMFRGKPASDSVKYKALGNSWAVNCARWIGARIAMAETITEARAA